MAPVVRRNNMFKKEGILEYVLILGKYKRKVEKKIEATKFGLL